jgi:hypothetical protein
LWLGYYLYVHCYPIFISKLSKAASGIEGKVPVSAPYTISVFKPFEPIVVKLDLVFMPKEKENFQRIAQSLTAESYVHVVCCSDCA